MIQFFVEGTPVPQGSMKAFPYMGKDGKPHATVTSDNPKLKAWRTEVKDAAKKAAGEFKFEPREPLRIDYLFIFIRPKTVKRKFHTVKPDKDKLVRAVNDALTDSWVVPDDAQIITGTDHKKYADEQHPNAGVLIRITELKED